MPRTLKARSTGKQETKLIHKKIIINNSYLFEICRLLVSDGVHFMQSILASQLSHYVADGTVAALSILKITQYNVNDVNNRK